LKKIDRKEDSAARTRLSVKVVPNSPRNELLGVTGGIWRFKIAAPPDKGKANKELIDFLSECLKVRKGDITILKGHTSRSKLLAVEGLSEEAVNRILSAI
jgi:uncharacterized protein (TIGR00251 family)